MEISVTILVKNGERHLREVLASVAAFDEVILYDTGSTDQTLAIAKAFSNVKIFEHPFTGFGSDHNAAAALAKNQWILSIDADEILTPQLAQEILGMQFDPQAVYSLPFHNFFNGRWIKWCGWYPEKHIRLYNKEATAFSNAMVHEGVIQENLKEITLQHPVNHYSYDTIADFLHKMNHYSTLFAEQNRGQRHSSPLTALGHGAAAFFRSYFLKRGFLGGYEGFVISAYNAHTAFYKYLKLYEANKCSSH